MSVDSVVEVRKRWGKLYSIKTSKGRKYLVLKEPGTDRFLRIGCEITEDDLHFLAGDVAFKSALNLAYRYMSIRDRAEKELKDLLGKDGVEDSDVVERVIDHLARKGFLDDRRLASNYIEFLLKHRPSGPHLIRARLRKLGLDEDLINEVIAEKLDEEREGREALSLALKKIKPDLGKERMVRRIHDFLLRRGFSSYIVNDICSKVLRADLTGEKDEE